MINKQKIWFLTLFSLILVLSVYYITMPSDLLSVTASKTTDTTTTTKASKTTETVSETDVLTALQVELDEERQALAAEYNEILTNKDTSTEEKNNAYDGLKQIDEIKAQEEKLEKILKDNLKLDSFIKIDGTNINVTVKKKDHDYSLANSIMRLINEEYDTKMYVSVKFQN
ncbi:MAG TPA: SpoIIIAH-like family protein [Candidatus Aphodocola excrementigallinarum]|uniref:SpoIIIAH-like family protein n=1 Tax=Candidatus Aphodocola excrementigallinarum TaxID=2840670 RepID=A0A9D1IP36_9FIRM|nr:SpoIIIAH-like family protein [Candidatus Aphodocola excrementigallinarum]